MRPARTHPCERGVSFSDSQLLPFLILMIFIDN
jgi:hypothetical protein